MKDQARIALEQFLTDARMSKKEEPVSSSKAMPARPAMSKAQTMSEGHPCPVAAAGWTSQTYFKNFRTAENSFLQKRSAPALNCISDLDFRPRVQSGMKPNFGRAMNILRSVETNWIGIRQKEHGAAAGFEPEDIRFARFHCVLLGLFFNPSTVPRFTLFQRVPATGYH